MSEEDFSKIYLQLRNFYIELHTMFGISQENNQESHTELNSTFKIRMACHGLSTKQLQEHLDWISIATSENSFQQEEQQKDKEQLSEEILCNKNNKQNIQEKRAQPFKLTPLQRFSCHSLAMQLLKKE
ncbi:hypothetical protein C9374_006396 [Naegleria lovaniensis]|uniref:Uncharacterized protein n=1 Tax=Naegleria lovaniensis TaxID=51637 RepID=A0AA88KHR3_NAELO|nr:uncharacterized protein C9374_006396 [Naegleria lovaniensis]KAG2381407.1 hypothetical protein C9374_006396 [Naegleria lovaniensis]